DGTTIEERCRREAEPCETPLTENRIGPACSDHVEALAEALAEEGLPLVPHPCLRDHANRGARAPEKLGVWVATAAHRPGRKGLREQHIAPETRVVEGVAVENAPLRRQHESEVQHALDRAEKGAVIAREPARRVGSL